MKRIVRELSITVFLLIFFILLSTVYAAQATETGLIDKSANMPSTMSRQISEGITNPGNTYLIEESAFHRLCPVRTRPSADRLDVPQRRIQTRMA